jgi:uncharacterized protein YlxW (UPF0749 family)
MSTEQPADPAAAWARVRAAARPRRSRAQVLIAVLLAGLGFAAAVQVHSTRKGGVDLTGARETDLIGILDDLDQRQARLQAQLTDLNTTRIGLRTGTDARALAESETRERIATLGVLAGTAPATGPGVVVRIVDTNGAVDSGTLLNAVQELRDAGAEAIQVNNVRVVASTWVADGSSHGSLQVDGTRITAPYVITAFGDSRTIAEALRIPGGVVDSVRSVGGAVAITEQPTVTVSALRVLKPPQYASPAPRAPGRLEVHRRARVGPIQRRRRPYRDHRLRAGAAR